MATIHLSGLPANAAYLMETVDAHHGFAYRDWQTMGSPEPPTREQNAQLQKLAWSTKKDLIKTNQSGELHWNGEIPAWAVIAIYPQFASGGILGNQTKRNEG